MENRPQTMEELHECPIIYAKKQKIETEAMIQDLYRFPEPQGTYQCPL